MSFNSLSNIIEELKIQAEEGIPFLVEGKKDEKALEELGIQGNFIKVSGSGLKLFEIAEIAAELSPHVIILTDFDRKGNELARRLSEDIERLGSHPNILFRKKLMHMTSRFIKDIESLPRHLDNLAIEEFPMGAHWYYH
ncbi:MAG: toprim domain-containing protein [Methanobacteriaceae archaeon]|jgi:5S rRNA maturation endonuclease (ribonuclease M5)|nr:toprim domain-containing protein [Methanobacteriaceae archaeon]